MLLMFITNDWLNDKEILHLTAPYSEERREAAWEYAREHDAADRLKWRGFVHKFVLYFFN